LFGEEEYFERGLVPSFGKLWTGSLATHSRFLKKGEGEDEEEGFHPS